MRNEEWNMGKRRTPEERYNDNLRRQRRVLEEFEEYEFEWSKDLLWWHEIKKMEVPNDVYRACAFFQNREYRNKRGSLALLYLVSVSCTKELPETTKENAFDVLRYKYRMYARALEKGGY